jgi:HK97 gp10 family phage protein
MPTITMTVRGGDQLRRNLDRLAGAERRRAQQDGLGAGIGVLETYVKVSLRGPSPSSPGEPPGLDIGNLLGSVLVDEVTPTQAILGVHAEYGEHLEFGTSRMEARPFLRPALDEHEAEIVQAVRDTVAAFVESVRA